MPTPSKFTAETRTKIIQALSVGASRRTAAAIAQVDEAQIRRWLKKGEDATEGRYRDFYLEVIEAEAQPRIRALGMVYKAMPDNPVLAWKFVERREPGFAPMVPQPAAAAAGPTVINLTLGGAAVPRWQDVEVIDATEVPSLSDGGSGDAASES